MKSFKIGQTVWFEGKKWEIADSFPQHGTYALGIRNAEGTWGKGSKSYGYKSKNGKLVEDPKCPFSTKYSHGFVPARYLAHALEK
jgi:hypothetical protein